MTFRELLEKYKEGTLTEEEKKLVESELEKNEAINDYLAENLDLTSSFNSTEEIQSDITTNKVRKTVNRRLLKVVALSVIIVFAILFSVKYIVSPLVSNQYYNPTSKNLDGIRYDLFYDIRALTEVTLPGYSLSDAYTEDLGFGDYKLSYTRTNTFNTEMESATVQLKKGEKFSDTFEALYGRSYIMWGNLLGMTEKDSNYKDILDIEKKKNVERLENLKELPQSSYVSAFIMFNVNLSMQELYDLMCKYQDVNFEWAAIKVADEGINLPIGFRLNPNGDSSSNSDAYYEKYPALTLGDYIINSNHSGSESLFPKGYELHFTTLMKYLSERPEAVSTLSYNTLDFKSYLNYINKNGVNTYAVLVYANVDDLLTLCENDIVKIINIDNVLPSKYSKINEF